jgi:membrane fusion protein
VSELDQQRREEALLEQRLNLNIRQLQVTEREGQRTDTRYALEQLPAVAAEKAQALRNELAGVEQRIAEVDGRRAYVVRAPIAGRVSSLQASVGQPADPRRLQLQIVPSDGALQAEMFVPAQAIGFVEVGQEVRFRYDAFPYQHYGSHRGRIIRISETVLDASDIAVPLALAGPAYRAVAALERPTVAAQGRQVALQPDMLLKADIILERRRLVRWILDPLLSAGFRG